MQGRTFYGSLRHVFLDTEWLGTIRKDQTVINHGLKQYYQLLPHLVMRLLQVI